MGLSQVANAAEVTRVASSFDQELNGNAFDLHFGVSYGFDFKKAAILREWGGGPSGQNQLARDLIYRQFRHTVTPTLEIGLWHDLSVYVALPVVVSDNRNFEFDKEEGGDCVFPTADSPSGSATCVNKTNSTSIRDGIVPRDGFDARESGDPYGQFTDPETNMIFRGPTRRGLDQIHVGMKIGILSQKRKSHLPDWVIGLEGRFAIAAPMSMSRDIQTSDPGGNHRVGRGIHELGAWTSLSRRYRFLEPFFGAHWRYAMRANKTNFLDFGGSQNSPNPQSETGAYFGAEIVPWEKPEAGKKFSIILTGSALLRYGGRAYSEVWELLADSPAMLGEYAPGKGDDCNRGAGIDYAASNPSDPSGYVDAANAASNGGAGGNACQAFNGITNVQDYGTFGLTAALNFHMGPYARLNFGVDMKTDTRHFLTTTPRGDGKASGDPNIVEPDSVDVNPVRRDVVDNVGRRYAIDDVLRLTGFANFIITF
ncbi:hypothetical protein ACNOYE_13470 [Nannocystaceae bacterium ST9]